MSEAPLPYVEEPNGLAAPDAYQPYPRDQILGTVRKYVEAVAPIVRKYRQIASINERFCHGDQWGHVSWTGQGGERSIDVADDEWVDDGTPRIVVNRLGNLVRTLASLLTKDRPSAKAYPVNSEDPQDHFDAALAQKFIDYFSSEEDTAQKIGRCCIRAVQHGACGLKVLFDTEKKRVRWSVCTIFNFLIDPVEDYREARWVIFQNYLPLEEAKALYAKAGIDREPRSTKYHNAAGERLDGVEAFELWHFPCADYPDGIFANIVDQMCVEQMPYPYVIENEGQPEPVLPIVIMKMHSIRESAYAYTPTSDAVEQQRLLNEARSRVVKCMRISSNPQLFVPSSLRAQFNLDEANVMFFKTAIKEDVKSAQYLHVDIDYQPLYTAAADASKEMNEIMGVNLVTSGDETRSISGRAIENIAELDKAKNAEPAKSLEDMIEQAWRLTIGFVRLFYTEDRQLRITGADSSEVMMFQAADIQGADVRLEPASELDSMSAVKQQAADERAQAGLPPLEDPSVALTSAASQQYAEDIVELFLAGAEFDLGPDDIDLAALEKAVKKAQARAVAARDRDTYEKLAGLLKLAKQLAAQAAQMAPVQQAAPAQKPAAQPAPQPEPAAMEA